MDDLRVRRGVASPVVTARSIGSVLLPALRHEVSFWHGDDRLCGDLRLPAGGGPHPVVLVVREPHELHRDYSAWLDVLADAGIASFSWDRPARLPACPPAADPSRPARDQAREVLAAMERVRKLPDLDPQAVALLGWGEGGWAAARAATYSDGVAALILASTAVGVDGGGLEAGVTLSAVTAPVLALFGEQDPLVDVRLSVRAVRRALRDGGHHDHEVAVLRGADHGLRVRAPHGLGPMVDGRHRFGDWPAGLSDLLVTWLLRHLRPEPIPTYAPPLHAPAGRLPARPRGQLALPPAVPVRQVRRRVPH